MLDKLNKNIFKNLFFSIIFILLSVYRFNWSLLALWGEDQATNLWLGYVEPISELNVGLISSQLIPNPNGMMVLGKLLSLLGSTLTISIFLTILNLFILYLFLSNFFVKKSFDFYLLFLFSGLSVLISSTTIEFWNQWILLTINLLIMNFIFRYINNNKVSNLYILILLIPLPVSVYLGGLTNTLVFGLILLFLVFKDYKKNNFNLLSLGIFTFPVISVYWLFSFKQFFNAVSFSRLTSLNSLSVFDRAKYFLNNLLKLPDGLLNTWNKDEKFVIFQTDVVIINDSTEQILELFYQFHKIIPLFAVLAFSYGLFKVITKSESLNTFIHLKKTNLIIFFISFSLVLSPIYGGPDFLIIQEKSNNLNQYYLFFILFWYLLPLSINNFHKNSKILTFNRLLFSIFIIINLTLGIQILNDHKSFEEIKATSIEAPIRDKIKVVDFISEEWKNENNARELSIKYDTFVTELDWFDDLSRELSEYYNSTPYTEGRVFDYELLRQYNLVNIFNEYDEPNFIVTNIFDSEPKFDEKVLNHYKFGRLRVSKINK
tara:strand:- start:4 stop:1638 length:1635 start_codon:yes stop_codon:yes gene_type:complete